MCIAQKSSSLLDPPRTGNSTFLSEQDTNPELTEIEASRDSITVSRKGLERRSTIDVTKGGVGEIAEERSDDAATGEDGEPARSMSADNEDREADEEVENLTTRFRKSLELNSDQLVSFMANKIVFISENMHLRSRKINLIKGYSQNDVKC